MDRIIKKKPQEKEKRIERKPCNTNPKTVKQLLGELYADREYLEKLLKDEESMDKKTQNSKEIRDLAVRGLNYLDDRSDFWQQEKPMYARKKYRPFASSRDASVKSKQQRDIIKYVVSALDEIDMKQSKSEHVKAIKQCDHLLKQLDKWSENDLPNRLDIEANVFCLAGNSYLEMGDYDKALQYHEKDNSMGKLHDLEEATSRSIDNLGRVYAKKGHFQKAIEIWQEKVHISKSALESTWLHHEMGRCYLELADYDSAMEYGEKSIEFAREAEDDTWQMNASILVAQAAANSKRFAQAIEHFDRALEYSKVMKNRDAEKAIKKAIEDVNTKIIEEDKEQRETIEEKDSDSYKAEDTFEPTSDSVEAEQTPVEEEQTPIEAEQTPVEAEQTPVVKEKSTENTESKTIEKESVEMTEEKDASPAEEEVVHEEKEIVDEQKEVEVIEEEKVEEADVAVTNETVENTETIKEKEVVVAPTDERNSPVADDLEEIPINNNSVEKTDENL